MLDFVRAKVRARFCKSECGGIFFMTIIYYTDTFITKTLGKIKFQNISDYYYLF